MAKLSSRSSISGTVALNAGDINQNTSDILDLTPIAQGIIDQTGAQTIISGYGFILVPSSEGVSQIFIIDNGRIPASTDDLYCYAKRSVLRCSWKICPRISVK